MVADSRGDPQAVIRSQFELSNSGHSFRSDDWQIGGERVDQSSASCR